MGKTNADGGKEGGGDGKTTGGGNRHGRKSF